MALSILGIENYWLIKNIFKSMFIYLFKKPYYEILLLEYGIDHPNEMDYLLNIAKPEIGILTWIDKIHLKNFENLDQLINEKYKLIFNTKN